VYNYKAEQLRRQGAPIDWFTIGKAIARPNGLGVMRRAPHPQAALLFYDFALSEEGQNIIAEVGFVPTSKKIDTVLNKIPITFMDPSVTIDEYDKWKSVYMDVFGEAP
jgi:iron(III) transport system substrate-binding protein